MTILSYSVMQTLHNIRLEVVKQFTVGFSSNNREWRDKDNPVYRISNRELKEHIRNVVREYKEGFTLSYTPLVEIFNHSEAQLIEYIALTFKNESEALDELT